MIERIEDDKLRHRIYQTSFRGIQRAIEEKAKECGMSVVYVDPRNTKNLPSAQIAYNLQQLKNW